MFQICFNTIITHLDIDECDPLDVRHDCHAHAVCTNTAGSFECNCLDGYIGNGVDCQG